VIGANSVVHGAIPPFTIASGVRAKVTSTYKLRDQRMSTNLLMPPWVHDWERSRALFKSAIGTRGRRQEYG
jgi:acyl-[acyl carrier protein]--UDP-N-acetylglucosamine O-acyltransferase